MKKRKNVVIVAGVILILIAGIIIFFPKGNKTGYTNVAVEKRDIQVYHSFTGTIEPVEEENVMPPEAGLEIKELIAEEGSEVKEGEVLMYLDSSDIDEQILELQATMDTNNKSNSISIQIAQKDYDDYKSSLDLSQNSNIISAQQSINNAYASLVTAQQKFNDEVKLNNRGLSAGVLSAVTSVDNAYNSVISAEIADDAQGTDASQATLDAAWVSYNHAVQSYEAAKSGEESTLTGLYNTLIQSQTTYLNALDNYNATVVSTDQQLADYALQLEKARVNADETVNQLKMASLKEQLNDCTVLAPMDGFVTEIPVNEGDVTMAGSKLLTVTSFDRMKIDVKINEYDILGAEVGKEVSIYVDALDKNYTGSITKIAKTATIENGVSYFEAEVDFQADEDTRSGMSVEVKLMIHDLKQVLAIPTDAIQVRDDGTSYVEVVTTNGENAVEQAISAGISDGQFTQITEGVKVGDVVLKPSVSEEINSVMGPPVN